MLGDLVILWALTQVLEVPITSFLPVYPVLTDMLLPQRPGGQVHPGPVSVSLGICNCDIETGVTVGGHMSTRVMAAR